MRVGDNMAVPFHAAIPINDHDEVDEDDDDGVDNKRKELKMTI